MVSSKRVSAGMHNVLSVVLGGGAGTRLFPLTKDRAKPAVPLAGKYRLVDIPISNCINSHLRRIYLLTQFNSASLHRHISQSYKFDPFSGGFVEILAAEQTLTSDSWYQGTADAVRKNLTHLLNNEFEYILVLSGDQLYRMDYRRILAQHVETYADVTVATIPVTRDRVPNFGIMEINMEKRIVRFEEKPKDQTVQNALMVKPEAYGVLGLEGAAESFLASMGIYVFNRDILLQLLDNDMTDFGKHIIPRVIHTHRVFSYVFQGYWEDVGTIRSFFEANLDLAAELPRFNFYDANARIFSRPRFLPGSKINGAHVNHAVVSDGCIINHANISHSIVGVRSIVGAGSSLHRVVLMGNDSYESQESILENEMIGRPRTGVGQNTRLENAIIDKNARIGDNVVLTPANKPENMDHPLYYIRDGIVIIPKNGAIPHGMVI
jgi:glucose-1-phosphate adenylyltransferase